MHESELVDIFEEPLVRSLQCLWTPQGGIGAGILANADISVTRATTKTFRNLFGRLHTVPSGRKDPVGNISPGITNYALRSESFDTGAVWSPANGGVADDAGIAPGDAMVAHALADDAANDVHYLKQVIAGTAVATCWSCYVAPGTGSQCALGILNNGVLYGRKFDLLTGISAADAAFAAPDAYSPVEQLANGWWRLWMAKVLAVDAASEGRIYTVKADGTLSYVGDGSTIRLSGAQWERSALPTPYIPTAGAVASRNTDVMLKANALWGSVISKPHSLLMVFRAPKVWVANSKFLSINVTDSNHVMFRISAGGAVRLYSKSGGANKVDLTAGTVPAAESLACVAYGYGAAEAVLYQNGVQVGSQSAGVVLPVAENQTLHVGTDVSLIFQPACRIRLVALFDQRLPNDALERLTRLLSKVEVE